MNGTVNWFNNSTGFGYITGEDGRDYYVHYTSIKKRPQKLAAGQKVSFISVSLPGHSLIAEEVWILG